MEKWLRAQLPIGVTAETELAVENLISKRESHHPIDDLNRPVQIHLRVEGTVDAASLRLAWQKLAEKPERGHEKVEHSNGNGNGARSGSKRAPWQEHDLRRLSRDEARTWIRSFLETDGLQGISAERYPRMRCAVLLTSDQECELVWSLHRTACEQMDIEDAIKRLRELCDSSIQVSVIQKEESKGKIEELENQRLTQPVDERARATDRVEEELIAIWETVLNTKPVGSTDDFFELGGHSLLAARLMARIEDALGVELPLASLLEAPTVRGQAELVRIYRGMGNEPDLRREPLAPRQLPFFFLGGDPTFRPLSQRLAELREFHSLGLRMSLLSKLKDPSSLECVAEQFVESIRERRPQGPYMLGGWCAHGLLAFETARQLQAQGQQVAQVVLLETANPVRMKLYSGWKRMIARAQLKFHLLKFEYAYVQQLNSTQTRNYIAGRTSQKLARIRQSLLRVLRAARFYPELNDPVTGNPLDLLYAASAKYRPKPYRGSVVLIRSTQRTFGFGHVLDLGWTELLGDDLEIRETPGNHYTIYMYPNVDTLARKINNCLKNAEERAVWQRQV